MKRLAFVAVIIASAAFPAFAQTDDARGAAELKKELDALKARNRQQEADMQVFVRQLEVQLAQIKELTGKIDDYRKKLAAALGEKPGTSADLPYARQQAEKLQEDLSELEKKCVEMARAKSLLEEKVSRLSTPGGKSDPAPKRALEGKVTAVSPEIGLVVISIGKEDGVLAGDEFTVHRGNEFVAKIVVDRLDLKWSASKILLKKSDPKVGDDVSNHIYVSARTPLYSLGPRTPTEGSTKTSADELRALRKELDEVRAQVRSLSDHLIPSWQGVGVTVEEAPEELRSHLGITQGLIVRTLREGGAAEKAGLRTHDVVPDMSESEFLRSMDAGSVLKIIRRGQTLTLPAVKRP